MRFATLNTVGDWAWVDERGVRVYLTGPSPSVADQSACREVLAAYRAHGAAFAPPLTGRYAIAILDAAAGRVVLAADHLGSIPLYFLATGDAVWVGSTPSRIVSVAGHERRLSSTRVWEYIVETHGESSQSFFSGVQLLPAGSVAVFDQRGDTVSRWWDPLSLPDQRRQSMRQYCDDLTDLLSQAVDRSVRSSGPMAAHITPGLDSTTVAQLAAARGRLSTLYSWAPAAALHIQGTQDERSIVQAWAVERMLDVVFPRYGASEWEASLSRPFEDEGNADVFVELSILAEAQSAGIRTILSGWGGDEGFSYLGAGIPSHLVTRGQWRTLWSLAQRSERVGRHSWGWRFRWLWNVALVPWMRQLPKTHRMLNIADFWKEPGIRERRKARTQPLVVRDPVLKARNLVAFGHLGERMRTWWAWGREFGVGHEYPLLDRELLEYLLGLPPELHWYDGYPRYLARHILSKGRPSLLTKRDPAQQGYLQRIGTELMQRLHQHLSTPAAPQWSSWIHMDRLKRAVQALCVTDDDMLFVEVLTAIRLLALESRFGSR